MDEPFRWRTSMRYHVPRVIPFINPLMRRLIGLGLRLGPRRAPMVLLTVRGRKSGQPRTTAVNMFDLEDVRYVVGTFGETDWVRNLRAAGEATLVQGGRPIPVDAVELPIEQAAPVLQHALDDAPHAGRGERDEIRVAVHEADVAAIHDHRHRVAAEEQPAPVRAAGPVEHLRPVEMTAGVHERDPRKDLPLDALPEHERRC